MKTMRCLTPEEVAPFRSAYMAEKFAEERAEIGEIRIDGNTMETACSMTSFYISPTDTGGFHLSIINTTTILSQLFIILGHICHGATRKEDEVFMLDYKINLSKAIRNSQHIPIRIEIREKVDKISASNPSLVRSKIRFAFDIGNGSFTGESTFHFTFLNTASSEFSVA
jgi:hypothetical protein